MPIWEDTFVGVERRSKAGREQCYRPLFGKQIWCCLHLQLILIFILTYTKNIHLHNFTLGLNGKDDWERAKIDEVLDMQK